MVTRARSAELRSWANRARLASDLPPDLAPFFWATEGLRASLL
jgi:hypothetical protein